MKFLRIIFCLFLLLIASTSTANASQFVFNTAKYYLYLTNPVSAFFVDAPLTPIYALIDEENVINSRVEYGFPLHHLPYIKNEKMMFENLINRNKANEVLQHTNFLVKILSFGSKDAMNSLNKAKILGEGIIPYKFVNFNGENDWFFVASSSNGAAMIVYGYSWFINLPAKFLKTIEKISYFSPKTDGAYPTSWWELIDLFISFLSLVIEIPLAFFGTIFGMILGTIMHPLDTLCALPASLYFMAVTTFNAVWDTIASSFLIVYNLFFVW